MFVWKDQKLTKKRPGLAQFKKIYKWKMFFRFVELWLLCSDEKEKNKENYYFQIPASLC